MTRLNPSSDTTLHLRRTFTAPREKVFRAWTDPEELKQWWGPEGCSTPIAEIDLRVGGKYRFGMKPLEGDLIFVSGTYREVRPPEKLVYTWVWEGSEMDAGETLVTVEFHDQRGATEIILTHEFFPNEKAREDHQTGWNGSFERLARVLSCNN